jgi:hypothetical protein
LTGNRIVVVPATIQQYWVDNQTTGAFTFTIAPSGGGASVNIAQGSRSILYCDGTDVLEADTQGVSFPITIAQGGTNATTASGARINLGGTSTGIAVFTAASQSAAQTSLGATATGSALFTAVDQAAAWTALGVAQAGNINGGTF